MAPRILHVVCIGSARGAYGGPFTAVISCAQTLRRYGFDAFVVAGHLKEDAPNLAHSWVETREVHRVLPGRGFKPYGGWSITRKLRREVSRADYVSVSLARELIPLQAAWLCLMMRRPLILQTHGMLTVGRTGRLRTLFDWLLVRPLVRRCRLIVALTDAESRDLSAKFGSGLPIAVVGNPTAIVPDARRIGTGRRKEVLFIARLHPRKRVQDFINAAKLSQEAGAGLTWTVIGPDGGELALVEDATRQGFVVYEGAIAPHEIPERLERCGVFVLPSLHEPWGLVLVDALAVGRPVIVTEGSHLASTIRASGSGVVVSEECPEEIFARVIEITSDDALYSSMAAKGQELVRMNFSAAVIEPLYADLHTRLIEQESPRKLAPRFHETARKTFRN